MMSYGTLVGATCGTMFPDHVDKLILDSTLPPSLDMQVFVSGIGEALTESFTKILRNCADQVGCPLKNPVEAFNKLQNDIKNGALDDKANKKTFAAIPFWIEFQELVGQPGHNYEAIIRLKRAVERDETLLAPYRATGDQFCMESSNTNNAILGVDVGNRLDHDAVIQLVLDAEAKFGQMAGGVAFIYASQTMARTNPHAEPIGALGNPNIETLVCANLHDA